jgi:hypothetical protein
MSMDEDSFETPDVKPESVLRRGRYMLPNLDGSHHPRGFMRVSNLVSAYSDQYALRVWEHLEVLKAVVKDPTLLDAFTTAGLEALALEDFGQRKEFVEAWLERAKAVSGGDEGSNFGTRRHREVEELHAGLPLAHHDAGARRHLALYASALQRRGLIALPDMQERIVLVPVLEVCGRIDNVLQYADGGLTIADLKTQRKFHTFLEVAAQFACYANAEAMWDAGLGRWVDMPHVSKDVALALWMPRETEDGVPRVDVYGVDIRAGWRTAQRAYGVVQDRAEAKSVKGNRAWLMPAPPVTEVEQYAARYAAVDSLREGRDLSAEVRGKGLWCPPIADAAQRAFDRLTKSLVS